MFMGAHGVAAVTADEKAQTVVHMLDYISVDYPEFVQNGKVLNQSELIRPIPAAAAAPPRIALG